MKEYNLSKIHWGDVFRLKDTTQVSWYQASPDISLKMIQKYISIKTAAIIDVGGGDSRLPDALLAGGFENISVLDISEYALTESQKRLGEQSEHVEWQVTNVLDFKSTRRYDLWHDRAVFHFLTSAADQIRYKQTLLSSLSTTGVVIMAAFSTNEGPLKCSGLEIQQHNRQSIENIFYPELEIIEDFEAIHLTPSGSAQNFYWSVLKRAQ